MACSIKIPLIFCLALLLSACDEGVSDGGNSGVFVLPQENSADISTGIPTENDTSMTLAARELDILGKIKQRASADGARYAFDELNPVFSQAGDIMKISFDFINPNTVGGTPVVEYSLGQGAITSIVYTQ